MKEKQLRKIVREELIKERGYELPETSRGAAQEIADALNDLQNVEARIGRDDLVSFTVNGSTGPKTFRVSEIKKDSRGGYRVTVKISGSGRDSEQNFSAGSFPAVKMQLIDLAMSYGGERGGF